MQNSKGWKACGTRGRFEMDDYECITADSVLSRPDPFWPVLKPKETDVPPPDVTVRKAYITDLEECLRLTLAMEKDEGRQVTDINGARLGVARGLVDGTMTYFVALIEGNIVGQVQVTPEYSWDDKQSWLISGLYTQADSRQKGVALALLKAVRENATTEGVRKFNGWVDDKDAPAKALYEKLGAMPTLRLYEWEEPCQLDKMFGYRLTPENIAKHHPCHPVTLSQKLSRDINHQDVANGLTRNGCPVSMEEVQKWDREGQVPESFLDIFSTALDLSEPETGRLNQTPVKNMGHGFIEFQQSFYKNGWFVYLWDERLGVYKTDNIERSEEGAKHQLGPQ